MKLITINVSKIHIRYEDDFYAQRPYSLGIVLDEFKIRDNDTIVEFDEPLDIKYEEHDPINKKNLYLKKIELSDLRVYWNSKAPPYIPESLIDQTKHSKNSIFEAIDAQTLHQLMLGPF